MGNTLKLISGIVLFVIGVLIAYETTVNNLIDVLLMVGFIIAIVGIVLLISYFVDSNTDRTTNILKEFLESGDFDTSSFSLSNRNSSSNNRNFNNHGPLRMNNEVDDYSYGDELREEDIWVDHDESDYGYSPRDYFATEEIDDSKKVLHVVNRKEHNIDLDKKLNFTPNYQKPVKVTRKPKKREIGYYDEIDYVPATPDKTEEIRRALQDETPEISPINSQEHVQDIQIDINHPERLPIPKSLRSNIISDGGFVSSQEAFDQLAVHVNKEIMLEIPSLNDLSDRFLSHVPTSYSRVIIDEFDLSDISYMVLVASLLKQGVHIKTVPKVHAVNLITDDSHAMIISDGKRINSDEYGAIYNDRNSISDIRADFEKTWSIASNLDENVILSSIAGGSA